MVMLMQTAWLRVLRHSPFLNPVSVLSRASASSGISSLHHNTQSTGLQPGKHVSEFQHFGGLDESLCQGPGSRVIMTTDQVVRPIFKHPELVRCVL